MPSSYEIPLHYTPHLHNKGFEEEDETHYYEEIKDPSHLYYSLDESDTSESYVQPSFKEPPSKRNRSLSLLGFLAVLVIVISVILYIIYFCFPIPEKETSSKLEATAGLTSETISSTLPTPNRTYFNASDPNRYETYEWHRIED